MDTQAALQDILAFMAEAGALAVANQKRAKVSYKDGNQALTETDLAISKLAQQRLKAWFDQPQHMLIDEESIKLSPSEVFAASEYQWVLDPIDGTAGYALGRQLYGISLGVCHRGKPILGAIYLPAQRLLVVADEVKAWRVDDPFTPQAQQEDLQCRVLDIHSQIFVESYFGTIRRWNETAPGKFWHNTPESAVQGFASALTGQAAGATLARIYSFWDVAAAAAIAQRAGYIIRSLVDARPLEVFGPTDFATNWKLAEPWLLCASENFSVLSAALKE